jgi:benzoyl-CoA reductase subunit BamC
MCVQVCEPGCLTYEERDVADAQQKETTPEDMEIGLESLVKKHGLKNVKDTLARVSKGK